MISELSPRLTKRQLAVLRLLAAVQVLEGVTEVPKDSNRGYMIAKFLKLCGLGEGYPWCAAVVAYAGHRALRTGRAASEWPLPLTAGCYALGEFAKKHSILEDTPEVGDVFLSWYASLKRFGHTGVLLEKLPNGKWLTIEGNTNSEGGREGWGMFFKERSFGERDRFIRWTALLPEE